MGKMKDTMKAKDSKADGWEEVPPPENLYRTWDPDMDTPAHVLTGILGKVREANTRHGKRDVFVVVATTKGEDQEGEWEEGQPLDVWMSVGVKHIMRCTTGDEVRITPNGREGQTKLFTIHTRKAQS